MTVLPLDGVRVLDLSGEIGSYGTKLLGDLGADVIKVEPLGGDRQRKRPPFARGEEGVDTSLVFAYYNSNKRGVEIDLTDPRCTAQLARLAAGRDLVVIDQSAIPPTPGWDPVTRTLSWADPGSIVCCLSAFGTGGPKDARRSTHLTSFAAGGQMQSIGPEDGPPRAIPPTVLYDELSAHAATAMMLALRERGAVGPQWIELSLHDMLAYRDTAGFAVFAKAGARMASRKAKAAATTTASWELSDGWVEVIIFNPSHWDGFVKLLGSPGELLDPALRDRYARAERVDELKPVIARLLADRSLDEVLDMAQEYRVPCAPLYTPYQATKDKQLKARGFWMTQDGPGTGPFTVPGLPFLSSVRLLAQHRRPAPLLGEHNAELLGMDLDVAREPAAPSTPPPISELKVLSFGTSIAGSVTATMLAEMGADVVKIEAPDRPDPLRAGPPAPQLPRVFEPSGAETTIMFAGYARSCRSASLNMKVDEDKEVFIELVRHADVLIDNFATGVMDRWGLSHQRLAELNPRLVMVTVCGYGRTGPRAHTMAYASTINSFSGMTRAWSYHSMHFDYTAVAHALVATFGALALRDRTGTGCLVDIAQSEAGGAMLAPLYLSALNFDDASLPEPNWVPGSLFSSVLRCAGQDRWLAVELENASDWSIALGVIDAPDLALAEGVPPDADLRSCLFEAFSRWAMALTPEQAERILQRAGLAAAAVSDIPDEYEDAQLWGRGAVTRLAHPDLGELFFPAPFQRLQRTPVSIRGPGARLGQDTEQVLTDWLDRTKVRA